MRPQAEKMRPQKNSGRRSKMCFFRNFLIFFLGFLKSLQKSCNFDKNFKKTTKARPKKPSESHAKLLIRKNQGTQKKVFLRCMRGEICAEEKILSTVGFFVSKISKSIVLFLCCGFKLLFTFPLGSV